MLTYAEFVSLASRGARWGDLEVLEMDDIEIQIKKNPIKRRKIVVREQTAVVVVQKIDWSLRTCTKPKQDRPQDRPQGKPFKAQERAQDRPQGKPFKAQDKTKQGRPQDKPCCSYFVETSGKKHGYDCKQCKRKN